MRFKRARKRACKRRIDRRQLLILVVALHALGTLVLALRGYRFGANTVVRCREGHLFTTIWIPGASLKALRLGLWRFQRCPVGNHWSLVRPVRKSELTDDQLRAAHEHKDVRIP
jgi:hypothetical protein